MNDILEALKSMNTETLVVLVFAAVLLIFLLVLILVTIKVLKNNDDDDNFVRLNWEQNLYKQTVYADVAYDFPKGGFHSATLKYYPDPSRLMGFEASCLRRNEIGGSRELLWGGAIDFIFVLRLAYNSAFDYDNMFRAKGTFIAEFHIDLGAFEGKFFGRGAAKAAPMETSQKSYDLNKFMKLRAEQQKMVNPTVDAQGNKVIEAKGIRYEKVDATQGGH